jgi:hypothetical protein
MNDNLVKLIQCGRRSCSHVLLEDERAERPNDFGYTLICPKCGNDDFYTLKENGRKTVWSERDLYRNGIDPNLIEPTTRMGPKMRAALLSAKERALKEKGAQ